MDCWWSILPKMVISWLSGFHICRQMCSVIWLWFHVANMFLCHSSVNSVRSILARSLQIFNGMGTKRFHVRKSCGFMPPLYICGMLPEPAYDIYDSDCCLCAEPAHDFMGIRWKNYEPQWDSRIQAANASQIFWSVTRQCMELILSMTLLWS